MKAYKVSCDDDDHGAVVVFAARSKDVSRYSNDCDCPWIDRRVHRAAEFDKYAPGPVTCRQYLNEGWYWGCAGHCWHEYITKEDEGHVITPSGERVFCSIACARKTYDEMKAKGIVGAHESVVALWNDLCALIESTKDATAEPAATEKASACERETRG